MDLTGHKELNLDLARTALQVAGEHFEQTAILGKFPTGKSYPIQSEIHDGSRKVKIAVDRATYLDDQCRVRWPPALPPKFQALLDKILDVSA